MAKTWPWQPPSTTATCARGITVRSSIDVMIAAFCIEQDYLLLHSDRDYDAIAVHRGLRLWGHG